MACLHGGPQQQGCSWKRGLWHDTETHLPEQRCQALTKSLCRLPLFPAPLCSRTYSPLASSSQISKKTIRSYLHWHGPGLGRVMVLSFVAGTMASWKDNLKGDLLLASGVSDGRQDTGRADRDHRKTHGGGSKAGGSAQRGTAPSQGLC